MSGFNRHLGISDEWFAIGDSLILTVLAQVYAFVSIKFLKRFEFSDCHTVVNAALLEMYQYQCTDCLKSNCHRLHSCRFLC